MALCVDRVYVLNKYYFTLFVSYLELKLSRIKNEYLIHHIEWEQIRPTELDSVMFGGIRWVVMTSSSVSILAFLSGDAVIVDIISGGSVGLEPALQFGL